MITDEFYHGLQDITQPIEPSKSDLMGIIEPPRKAKYARERLANMTQYQLVHECHSCLSIDTKNNKSAVINVIGRAHKGVTLTTPERNVLIDFLARQ